MTEWRDDEGRVHVALGDDGVAQVRLTRPDKMNALDPAMFAGITGAIARLERMAGLRCVVLSGEGRAFCAGLDLASMASGGVSAGLDICERTHGQANLFQQVSWGWRTLPVPVIAAVHGVAFGGGFQIMSGACIRIAAPDTRMAIMEMKWGLVPDMSGIALWRGTVRDDVLRELAYTAREFSAAEAERWGLVTHCAADPLAEATALAQQITARNPDAVRGVKRLANAMHDEPSSALLMAESVEQKAVLRTPNQLEAVMAGMQKRAAKFEDPAVL